MEEVSLHRTNHGRISPGNDGFGDRDHSTAGRDAPVIRNDNRVTRPLGVDLTVNQLTERSRPFCYLHHGESPKYVRNVVSGPDAPPLIRSDGHGVTVWKPSASSAVPTRLLEPRSGQRCSSKDDAVPTNPVSLRPALARRAAVVAGSAAAAALFATVPAAPAATPAAPPASPTVTVSHAGRSARRAVGHLHAQPAGGRGRRPRRGAHLGDAQGPRQGRRPVPLRRLGPQRLRLLRPGQLGLPELGQVAAAHQQGHCRASAPRSRSPRCSPATSCSSTAARATSASTSATARSCTRATRGTR